MPSILLIQYPKTADIANQNCQVLSADIKLQNVKM
jgi:hypothetical protein